MGKARWVWELDGIGAKTCMTLHMYLFLVNLTDINASTPCYHQTVNSGHLVEERGTGGRRNGTVLPTIFHAY